MKVYTLARSENVNYDGGPGGSSTKVLKVAPVGAYGSGGLPPVFTTKEKAKEYRKTMEFPFIYKVIGLEVYE